MKREAKIFHKALNLGRLTLGLSLASGLLFVTAADAQINRSRPTGGGSSGGSSDKSGDRGSDKSSGSGSSSGSSSGGSSRGSSGSDRGGSSGSSSGGSERTRTPPERGSSSGSGSRPERGSGGGSSDSGSGGLGGIFNRSRPSSGGSSDSGSGSSRPSSGTYGGSRSSGSGSSRPTYGSGSAAERLNGSRSGGSARGSWSNSREASSGRLAPFSYNTEARTRSIPNNYERFTHSREGYNYRYRNGTYGRSELYVYNNGGWGRNYFVNNCAYYPYYRPAFVAGITCYSPYAYYWEFYPSYITLSSVYYAPPSVVYVPYPVYTDTGRWRGFRYEDVDDYYLNRRERADQDFEQILNNNRQLNTAVNDITDGWKSRDIQVLARHTRKEGSIAVYLRGKYQYSLPSVDYLDMTRDAFRTSNTVRFRLDRIERKDRGVYLVSGRHTYRDKDDEERTVYINYVLERGDDDEYYITQVGSSPDKLNDEE